uniref:Uncharacterized protein n=1 Tax=Oryza brachyantha TaxID=4533 RepID=J3M278_ORYBR
MAPHLQVRCSRSSVQMDSKDKKIQTINAETIQRLIRSLLSEKRNIYLSKPAPGFVGEVTRVVADEVVPEPAVRQHEPLAGVGDAMIRLPPLLLPGAFHRRGLASQPQLLHELVLDAGAPAVVSIIAKRPHLHGHG